MDRAPEALAFDQPRRLARSLRGYRWSRLPRDVVGGALIVAIAIPLSMGMAEVAGLPPIVGLYSCVLAPLAFAVFGSSRQLVVALDASTAALLGAAIASLASGDPAREIALASLVALLVGAVLIAAGLARVGVIATLLSHPVLLGYQAGLAVVVIISQLPKLIGVQVTADTTLASARELARSVGDARPAAVVLGAACLIVIGVMAWLWPKVPGALVAIVLAAIAVELVGFFGDVAVVGTLPSGLPALGLPHVALSDVWALMPAALAIAVISSADTIVTSRAFAERGAYDVDASTDMLGVGVANAASGASGGITISASAARTAVVEMVGVRTQMAAIVAAILMTATLVLFTGVLAHLPLAALGAVVVGAVLRLVDVPGFRTLWRIDRLEWAVAALTAAFAIGLGLLQGVVIGAALSFAVLLIRSGPSTIARLRPASVTAEKREGVTIVHLRGPVVSLNAPRIVDGLRHAVGGISGAVVVDVAELGAVDATGAVALTGFAWWVERNRVDVVMAGLTEETDTMLSRAGFWQGPHVIDRATTVDEALQAVGSTRRLE
jgi:MFS superfamily sulfate permease-like transporter